MNNCPLVSLDNMVFGCNTTSSIEVASLSVMISVPTISVAKSLDQERTVISRTKGRLSRMGDDIGSF